jgi:hypothetical protein
MLSPRDGYALNCFLFQFPRVMRDCFWRGENAAT